MTAVTRLVALILRWIGRRWPETLAATLGAGTVIAGGRLAGVGLPLPGVSGCVRVAGRCVGGTLGESGIRFGPAAWVLVAAAGVAATIAGFTIADDRRRAGAQVAAIGLGCVTTGGAVTWADTGSLTAALLVGMMVAWWALDAPIPAEVRGIRRRLRQRRLRRVWADRLARVAWDAPVVPGRVLAVSESSSSVRVELTLRRVGAFQGSDVHGFAGLREVFASRLGTFRLQSSFRRVRVPDAGVMIDSTGNGVVVVRLVLRDAWGEREPVEFRGRAVKVGTGELGDGVWVSPQDGSILVAGATGSGKSQFLRTVAAGVVGQERDQLFVIDLSGKGADWAEFEGGATIAVTVDEARTVLAEIEELRLTRQAGLGAVTSMSMLPQHQQRWVTVIVDEFASVPGDLKGLVTALAKVGRSAGVRLVVAAQTPTSRDVPSDLLGQLPVRWVGHLEPPKARVAVDEDQALVERVARLPVGGQCRGLVRVGDRWTECQATVVERVRVGRVREPRVPVSVGREAVFGVVDAAGEAVGAQAVADALGRDRSAVKKDLDALVRVGRLVVVVDASGRPVRPALFTPKG